jgi:hypothetical protein
MMEPIASAAIPASDAVLDARAIDRRQMEQNLPMAFGAGGLAALAGAAAWALVTVVTGWQIGLMAVGVGALVGYVVGRAGKGLSPVYGYIGAGWALFGCVFGNLLSVCAFIGIQEQVSMFAILGSLSPASAFGVLTLTFSPIDLLFYGFAVLEGYKLSFSTLEGAA